MGRYDVGYMIGAAIEWTLKGFLLGVGAWLGFAVIGARIVCGN